MIPALLFSLLCTAPLSLPSGPAETLEIKRAEGIQESCLYQEGLMGSWLEIRLAARNDASREAAEILGRSEIARLAAIFDHRRPDSEISRLCACSGRRPCSPELAQVLQMAKEMQKLSGGRFSPGIAPLLAAWKNGRPSPEALKTACEHGQRLADYRVGQDPSGAFSFERESSGPLILDAISGGFIADTLVARIRALAGIEAVLVNVSGDIACSASDSPWTVAIPNPQRRGENLPGLASLPMPAAISTSGSAERHADRQGRFSHLVDARNGEAVDACLSCSVIAPSCAEADALATALSLMPRDEARELLASRPACSMMQVAGDGSVLSGPGFPEAGSIAARLAADAASPGLDISFELKNSTPQGKFHKHFTAVWIEDASGKKVVDLALWGRKAKYFPSLKAWWKAGGQKSAKNPELMKLISGPSRAPGVHNLSWDLLDAEGKSVKPGQYSLCVEVNREKGPDKEKPILAKVSFDTQKKAFVEKAKDSAEIVKLSISRKK